MSSMVADVRGAAVASSRLVELSGIGRIEDEDKKLDLATLLSVALRVVQVLILVRMINVFFGWV